MAKTELLLVLLALSFLILKVTSVVAWPWFVITAPIWIPVLFTVTLGSVLMACIICLELSKKLLR